MANLAASPQPAAIELPPSAVGAPVVEMIDDIAFPSIRPEPHPLALASHACYWLQLLGAPSDGDRNVTTSVTVDVAPS